MQPALQCNGPDSRTRFTYHSAMDWKSIITDIRSRKITLQEIATQSGMSRGQVHDLITGRGKTVVYETGVKLIELHKRTMRRKSRQVAEAA